MRILNSIRPDDGDWIIPEHRGIRRTHTLQRHELICVMVCEHHRNAKVRIRLGEDDPLGQGTRAQAKPFLISTKLEVEWISLHLSKNGLKTG